jgi:hypothetical protein
MRSSRPYRTNASDKSAQQCSTRSPREWCDCR